MLRELLSGQNFKTCFYLIVKMNYIVTRILRDKRSKILPNLRLGVGKRVWEGRGGLIGREKVKD